MATAGSFDSISVHSPTFGRWLGCAACCLCIADGMRQKLSLFLLIFLASIVPVAASQTNNPQLSRAQEVWEEAIRAKGGREKLEAVRNIFISSRSKYWHGLKRYEVFSQTLNVFPGKMWWWQDYRPDVFGLTVELYDFDRGIKYYTSSDVPPPAPHLIDLGETSLSRTYGLLGYLMETKWLKPTITGVSEKKVKRKKVDVVHTFLVDTVADSTVEYFYLDFWIDRTSRLPVRVSFSRTHRGHSGSSMDVSLSSYVDVNGVKVPSKEGGDKVLVMLNVDYNDELFSKPPSLAAGPDAWKPN